MNTVTIIIPISRANFLKELFASLEALECDVNSTGLFVYIDGDLTLFEKAQRFVAQSKFKQRECVYRRRGIPSVGSVRGRRKRIADIHNEIKIKIPESEYVFLIEDDTIVPPNALQKLIESKEKYLSLFISGIELGRWGFPIIGAWKSNYLNTIESMPLLEGLQPVNAAGFYCMLMEAKTYKGYTFKPFEQILGPDVDFGMYHALRGFIDYDIKCIHLTQKEPLTFDVIKPVQLRFTRDDSNKFGWRQEVL